MATLDSQHDPDYCDKYRQPGHVCNQPHASDDPMGANRPEPREVHDRELDEARQSYFTTLAERGSAISPFVRRALAGELPAKETYR